MSSLNIFIVDDNQDFAESLADLLMLDGHHVDLAFDGETARLYDSAYLYERYP